MPGERPRGFWVKAESSAEDAYLELSSAAMRDIEENASRRPRGYWADAANRAGELHAPKR